MKTNMELHALHAILHMANMAQEIGRTFDAAPVIERCEVHTDDLDIFTDVHTRASAPLLPYGTNAVMVVGINGRAFLVNARDLGPMSELTVNKIHKEMLNGKL